MQLQLERKISDKVNQEIHVLRYQTKLKSIISQKINIFGLVRVSIAAMK